MASRRRRLSGILGAVIAVTVLCVALYEFEAWFAQPESGKLLTNGALNDAQKKALETSLDLTKSFMTWALAIIGGAGFFLKLGVDKSIVLRRRDVAVTALILLLSVSSIYFGQLGIDLSVSLLSVLQFPLDNSNVRVMFRSQYIAVLAAIGVFGIHVFDFFWSRTATKSGGTP